MKKKLKLSEVKVASFVTELDKSKSNDIKGQRGTKDCLETMFSCLHYVSCDPRDCNQVS